MKPFRHLAAIAAVLASTPLEAATLRCPRDSVKVGTTCVDKYEASVWQVPPESRWLVKKLQAGKATLADLTAGGATLVSPAPSPLDGCPTPAFPATFPVTGNWTEPLYAASVAGVIPTACMTWFQAEQTCALSGKRLLTNEEWQRAATGTPDQDQATTGDPPLCKVSGPSELDPTGSWPTCVSSWGTYDMVGNVAEIVADWDEVAFGCGVMVPPFGDDITCFGGPGASHPDGSSFPAQSIRGGGRQGHFGGPFTVRFNTRPSETSSFVGFRCAR